MRTLVLACLLLAGCGGKGENRKMKIAFIGSGLQTQQMPVLLAQQLGYYKEEGLDVTLESLSSNTKTMQSLVGGSVDAAAVAYSQTIQIAVEGQRVRAFFVMVSRNSVFLVVSPAANERIKRIEDLKGATIGVPSPGAPNHLFVNYHLTAHGIRPSEVTAVGVGVGASAVAAFESGRVDAAAVAGGDHLLLLKRHPNLRILSENSTPEGMRSTYGAETFAGSSLAARQEWLDQNPDTVRRLTRALLRTHQWIGSHTQQEIWERLPGAMHSQDAALDVQIIGWSLGAFNPDGKMPNGAPEVSRRYLDATIEKVREAKIDLAATWTNEYLPQGK